MENHLLDYFANHHAVVQALVATLFTWAITAVGAAVVFFTKRFNQASMDGILGLAAGVMIAASFCLMPWPSPPERCSLSSSKSLSPSRKATVIATWQ